MASQGSGSDGAPQSAGSMLSTSTSTSSRRRDMASKLENATSLSIRVLQEITDNFSDKQKIGQGAYGMVYKAQLESGEEIAVKILYNTTQGINDVQFQREFENLMSLEHQNIVRLVGYCYETQHRPMQHKGKTIFTERIHRALCFEYMENGCLEKHISDERGGLDWHTRYKIIRGSWEGLKYLHEGFDEPMYHLDLKPENILLDESMTPKLADFGLSKLFNDKQTRITQSTMGTIGYLPREYLHGQTVSNKFDIFSLGVVMIKIIAGHGGNSRSADMPRQEFLDQVHENWKTRMLQTHGASRALGAYCKQVTICTDIALSCMEIDRHKRPTIEDIIRQLDETEDTINEALPSGTSTGSTHSATKRDLVKLEALASSEAVPCGDSCDEYAILVRVTARPWRQAEEIARPGVDLVLVLDEMNDWRKFAMNRAMTKLGPNDRLAVVSGKGQCALDLTFMSDEDGDIGRLMVEELPVEKPNMVDSVREAAEILKKRQVEEGDSRLGFIIALSYERSWDPAWARMISQSISSQFPVHTLGLGMGHHKALKYVADQTSGTHSFTRAGGNDVIKAALELIIGGITKVAATSITITLTAHEGVAISSIESGGYGSRVNSEERRSGEIDITDIYAGETKKFIVKLKLPEGDMAKLLTIGGQYWSPNAASKRMLADTEVFVMRPRSVYAVAVTMETELSKKKKKKRNKRRGAPAVAVPPPPNWAIHPEVAAELVRVQLAKAVSAFPDVDRESIRSDIEGLWKKVRSSVEGKHAPQEALADLAEDMSEMEFNGKKMDYILSWLSSHQWQRATTKGGRSDSGAFMVQCNALSSTASTNSAIKGDLVKVEGLTSTNAVQSIEPWWEDGPLYPIMVRVTAPPRRRHAEEMRRAGVDLVLVLDLFDSYIRDTNKQAMTVLIHKLGPNDRLSVVSGRTVKLTLTSMSGKGRDVARLMVDERTDHFNMVDSVREASKILEGRPVEEGDSRLGFIMVLWHLGNKEPAILKQKISSQFPVHTLSVGPDDGYYGAEVGKYIADQTSGTYSFIEEGGLDKIKEALELFIGGITKVAATFITITIKAHPGVDISSIESGRYYSRMDYHYISGEIDIGDIYVGETKNFIVNLKLKQGEGKRKLLTIGGKYCSLNASTQWQRLADTEVSVLLPDSEGWSPEKVDIHPEVHAELVRVQIVKDLLTMLKADKRSFMADIDKLRKKITWVGEGDINKTLAGLVKDIAEIEKDSMRYGRRKVPYVLSWLSCHEWQRATTKGLRSDSGAFMV